uniref:Uncharacterized protein n=1 Tax=Ditylenchus dipsaci TaxID=166011 RepID=A0A915DCC0_9BILA
MEVVGCGQFFKVSEQGMALDRKDHEQFKWRSKYSKRGGEGAGNYRDKRAIVTSEQLSSQLSAGQVTSYNRLLRVVKVVCHNQKLTSRGDPTIFLLESGWETISYKPGGLPTTK